MIINDDDDVHYRYIFTEVDGQHEQLRKVSVLFWLVQMMLRITEAS